MKVQEKTSFAAQATASPIYLTINLENLPQGCEQFHKFESQQEKLFNENIPFVDGFPEIRIWYWGGECDP